MERLAENQFTITKGLFMEGMLRISRDSYGKAAAKAMLLVLGLWGAFFLYTLAAGGDVAHALLFLVIIGMAGLWLCEGIPRSNANRAWKVLEGKYGSNLHRTTSFYPDHLEIQGEGLEKHISYDQITRILRSRRLLILVCQDKVGILLALDGFTDGNAQQVKALIEGAKDKE